MLFSRLPFGIRVPFLLFLVLLGGIGALLGKRKLAAAPPTLSLHEREGFYGLHDLCGKACLERGDLTGAFNEYNEMIALFPNRPEPYGLRGSIQNMREHSAFAVADDSKALERMPSCVTACGPIATAALLTDRAKSYRRMGNSAQALKDANAALHIVPAYPGAHLVRAEAELDTQHPKEAITDSTWTIDHHEDGQVYALALNASASSDAHKRQRLMADSALFAHMIRGAAEGQLGKYAAATADTQTVVAAHPNHAEYWTDCAWYQFKSGRLSAAITTARDGLQLSDASALDYFNLGLYYAMAGDENAARNTYAAGLQFRDAATALPGARADIADELKAHPGNPLLLKAHGWLAVR